MKITAGTIARTIILALAIVNRILVASGKPAIEIGDDMITEFISDAFVIVMAIITWWKNNSFTLPALKGDELMRKLKKARKEGEVIEPD